MTDASHLQLSGFGIANYRSFDEEGFVVDHIGKINIFIGKNNSGKSNIIRAIRLLRRVTKPKMPQGEKGGYDAGLCLKPEIDSHGRRGTPPSVTVDLPQGQATPSDRIAKTRGVDLRRCLAALLRGKCARRTLVSVMPAPES